jgi:hypothetical protein
MTNDDRSEMVMELMFWVHGTGRESDRTLT